MNVRQRIFTRLYRQAPTIDSLPWHRETPPDLLVEAIAGRTTPARALDLGCGEGVNAIYLAQRGFDVVAVDFIAEPLAEAKRRAAEADVTIEFHQCDVLDYADQSPFDVVLDSGCLHHIPSSKAPAYRVKLDSWLAPGGDFVLVHFAHRPRFRWIPAAPAHMKSDDAVAFFAPLELRSYDETTYDVPMPMGTMTAGVYWFRRGESGSGPGASPGTTPITCQPS